MSRQRQSGSWSDSVFKADDSRSYGFYDPGSRFAETPPPPPPWNSPPHTDQIPVTAHLFHMAAPKPKNVTRISSQTPQAGPNTQGCLSYHQQTQTHATSQGGKGARADPTPNHTTTGGGSIGGGRAAAPSSCMHILFHILSLSLNPQPCAPQHSGASGSSNNHDSNSFECRC